MVKDVSREPSLAIPKIDALHIGSDHRVDMDSLPDDVCGAVEKFNFEYNQEGGQDKFFDGLYRRLGYPAVNGLRYAVFAKPCDSKSSVILSQTPFGTGVAPRDKLHEVQEFLAISPEDRERAAKKIKIINSNALNTLIKTALLDYINRETGVVDSHGQNIPIIVVPGTGVEYSPQLSVPENWRMCFNGDFSPYAKRALEVAQRLHYGKEAVLPYGYSRGAAVAAEMLRLAPTMGMDALGAVLVESPNYRAKFFPKFAGRYMGDFEPGKKPQDISGDWLDDGPAPVLDIRPGSDTTWQDNLTSHLLDNLLAAHGMTKGGRMLDAVKEFVNQERKTVVLGYGETSGVTGSDFEREIEEDLAIRHFAHTGLIKVLVARGMAPHSFGENHIAHAAFFNQGIRTALAG